MTATLRELTELTGRREEALKRMNQDMPESRKMLIKRGTGYDLTMFVRRYAENYEKSNRGEMLLRELAARIRRALRPRRAA